MKDKSFPKYNCFRSLHPENDFWILSWIYFRSTSSTSTALFASDCTNSKTCEQSCLTLSKNRYPVSPASFCLNNRFAFVALKLHDDTVLVLNASYTISRSRDYSCPNYYLYNIFVLLYCSLEYSFGLNVDRFLVNSNCSANCACSVRDVSKDETDDRPFCDRQCGGSLAAREPWDHRSVQSESKALPWTPRRVSLTNNNQNSSKTVKL